MYIIHKCKKGDLTRDNSTNENDHDDAESNKTRNKANKVVLLFLFAYVNLSTE